MQHRKFKIGIVVATLAVAAACTAEDPLGVDTQAIVGGTVDTGDPAVVLLMGSGGCTGTLVAPNVVLTAAHCLPTSQAGFGSTYNTIEEWIPVTKCIASRYYTTGIFAGHDIAMCKLSRDAPVDIEPIPLNTESIDDYVGAEIRTVGFGYTDGETQEGWGIKRQLLHIMYGVQYEFIVTGDEYHNTCQGDSGGPTFLSFDGTERVIAVTSFGAGGCLGVSHQTRVDVYIDRFLAEVVAAWYGPCSADGDCVTEGCETIDPDCDVCGYDGVCAGGCVKKDLDCPVGLYHGESCGDREACEDLLCLESVEDSRVKYCSAECDPARPEDNFGCQPPLTACEDNGEGVYQCRFSGITPSVQGATCAENSECRSGVCHPDDAICVEQCGDGLPDCADPYVCDAVGGVDACILPKEKGCSVTPAGRRSGSVAWLLAIFAALLVAVGKKRRISASH